jgi:hypothetical protein
MVGVAPRLLDVPCMPTNEKSEKHDDADELKVEFEPEVDDDEDKKADDDDEDADDEAEVVDIDLDDLSSMEGPDA